MEVYVTQSVQMFAQTSGATRQAAKRSVAAKGTSSTLRKTSFAYILKPTISATDQ